MTYGLGGRGAAHSPSSSLSAGGTSPSSPRSRSSSVIRSNWISPAPSSPRPLSSGRNEGRNHFAFGLVDLDMPLQRMDQVFHQILGREGGIGDFAQGDDRIFVIISFDSDRCAGRNHPRAVAGDKMSSKRFSTLSMQSSTVTRAMGAGSCSREFRIRMRVYHELPEQMATTVRRKGCRRSLKLDRSTTGRSGQTHARYRQSRLLLHQVNSDFSTRYLTLPLLKVDGVRDLTAMYRGQDHRPSISAECLISDHLSRVVFKARQDRDYLADC